MQVRQMLEISSGTLPPKAVPRPPWGNLEPKDKAVSINKSD
jgi:hypothetical protein